MQVTTKRTYKETLFQWIWQQSEFNKTSLSTTCGKQLEIIDPGRLNHGAGPDFLGSKMIVDGLLWHGHVEVHRQSSEWNHHRHQMDPEYDNVILHVVYEHDAAGKVFRSDGSKPYTLNLKPYLSNPLNELVGIKQTSGIPCKGKLAFINQRAFEKQIGKVSKEYFDYKVQEILSEYSPEGTVSKSWMNVLIVQVYKTLGIPLNRDQMRELAYLMISDISSTNNPDSFIACGINLAFGELNQQKKICWTESGMRPASRPKVRVKQALAFHFHLINKPFDIYLKNPEESWNELLQSVQPEMLPGKTRLQMIKHTGYLPAIYLLGQLLQSANLMDTSYNIWLSDPHKIPDEIQKPFRDAGFVIKGKTKTFGLAHQLKRYCNQRECYKCNLFKSAIRS